MAKSKHRSRSKRVKRPSWQDEAPPSITGVELPRPESNTRLELTLVPEFRQGSPGAKIQRTREGMPGTYRVTFVLSIPGKATYRSEVPIQQLMKSGESLLAVSPGDKLKLTMWNQTESVDVLLNSNAQGVISSAELRLLGKSFADVERTAYDLFMPQLSYFSYLFNVAIDVVGYEVLEETTASRKYVFGILGQIKKFELSEDDVYESIPEYRRILAAYREGMNATNVFYQVLSFYKAAEGIRSLRTARKASHSPSERIPERLEDIGAGYLEEAGFKAYLGQKFTRVLDHYRSLIRNAVAHLDPAQNVLDIDNYGDVVTCLKAVPVLRYIARIMISNELEHRKPTSQEPPPLPVRAQT